MKKGILETFALTMLPHQTPRRHRSRQHQPYLISHDWLTTSAPKPPPVRRPTAPLRKLRDRRHFEIVARPTVRSNKPPVPPSKPFEPQSSTLFAKGRILRGEPKSAKPMYMASYRQPDHSEQTQVDPPPRRPSLVTADITSIHGLPTLPQSMG